MTVDILSQLEIKPTDGGVAIADVRVEHQRVPFGIDVPAPRLSWIVETERAGWLQSAYEVEVRGMDEHRPNERVQRESTESVLVPWEFTPLASRERVAVRVRVQGNDEEWSSWSAEVPVEMGLLTPDDWSAGFVTPEWDEDLSRPQPAPYLRHEFEVRGTIAHARLYATALGVYEAQLNGVVVSDTVFDPGWTVYPHRLRYQTYDVTALLQEGRNALGVVVADGWYRGRLGFHGGKRNNYGERLALLAQLEITYTDGTTERIVSDESWHATTGAILASDIYDGERYDARLEWAGWSSAGFDDRDWVGVREIERDFSTLIAPSGPPVRRIEEVAPIAISRATSGRILLDFGQNLVGRLRIRVQGVAGQTITLRHAEVLEGGELCMRPLRFAEATDRYTLRGDGIEVWEPRFTSHGFRYADIEGWSGEVYPDDVRALVLHSDMERTGWFDCSDPLLNQLHQNVLWSMRGNFLDVPTDCPQRDERLGWTGDLQVFAPTASYLYDVMGFLQSWLRDLAVEQQNNNGVVPIVVPDVIPPTFEIPNMVAAAWGDAAVIVPWVLYQRFGDATILATQFESMRVWVEKVASIAGEAKLWNDSGIQFGDWLDPIAPHDNPWAARTPNDLVATAYFAYSTRLLGQSADIIGRTHEAEGYLKLADQIRDAFVGEYLMEDGTLRGDSVTGYALALQFDLLPTAAQRQRAGERLETLVREGGYRISTGFVGTPLVCDALWSVGEYDTAFRLLMEQECPSWLYPVTMGATTIWERWDSMLPDGSINPGEMTSFNHYALGAVADWMHRTIGGLAPATPGYRHLAIQPHPGGGLTYARATHRTPYGLADCAWRIEDGVIHIEVLVPANTTAIVTLPHHASPPIEVGSGRHEWEYQLTVDS